MVTPLRTKAAQSVPGDFQGSKFKLQPGHSIKRKFASLRRCPAGKAHTRLRAASADVGRVVASPAFDRDVACARMDRLRRGSPVVLETPASFTVDERIPIHIYWPRKYALDAQPDENLANELNADVAAWLDDLNIPSERVVAAVNPGLFVALLYPKGLRDRMLIAAKFLVVSVIMDDMLMEMGASEHVTGNVQTLSGMLDMMQSGEVETGIRNRVPRPVLDAWEDVCGEFRAMADASWLEVFHWSLMSLVEGCYLKLCMAKGRIDQTMENYGALRIHDSGTLCMLVLCDWVQGYNAHAHGSPLRSNVQGNGDCPYNADMLAFISSSGLGVSALLNDCLSAHRETESDLNALDILNAQVGRKMSEVEAALSMGNVINKLLWDGEDALEGYLKGPLNAGFTDGKPTACGFIEDVRIALVGLVKWQIAAERYNASPFRVMNRRAS